MQEKRKTNTKKSTSKGHFKYYRIEFHFSIFVAPLSNLCTSSHTQTHTRQAQRMNHTQYVFVSIHFECEYIFAYFCLGSLCIFELHASIFCVCHSLDRYWIFLAGQFSLHLLFLSRSPYLFLRMNPCLFLSFSPLPPPPPLIICPSLQMLICVAIRPKSVCACVHFFQIYFCTVALSLCIFFALSFSTPFFPFIKC